MLSPQPCLLLLLLLDAVSASPNDPRRSAGVGTETEARIRTHRGLWLLGAKLGAAVDGAGSIFTTNTLRIFGKVVNYALSLSYGNEEPIQTHRPLRPPLPRLSPQPYGIFNPSYFTPHSLTTARPLGFNGGVAEYFSEPSRRGQDESSQPTTFSSFAVFSKPQRTKSQPTHTFENWIWQDRDSLLLRHNDNVDSFNVWQSSRTGRQMPNKSS